jgi:hypothetical protein
MTADIAQQEFDAAKSQLRVAWLAKESAEREFRANPARGLAALNAARDAETRAQLTADRALVAVMREESRELIAEARAAMDAAIDRKHAALNAQGESRGYGGTFHPQMRMFNEDIAATSDALHELELPIVNAEINLRWAEDAYARLCAERDAVDNYCCLDYTEHRTEGRRAKQREEADDMYAARDFTPLVEALKRGEKHV